LWRRGQMWILKNSKDLLEYIQSRTLSSCNSIKTFDLSTLYTTILYPKLKDILKELVQLCYINKNGQRISIQIPCLRKGQIWFGENHSDSIKKVLCNWYHKNAWIFLLTKRNRNGDNLRYKKRFIHFVYLLSFWPELYLTDGSPWLLICLWWLDQSCTWLMAVLGW